MPKALKPVLPDVLGSRLNTSAVTDRVSSKQGLPDLFDSKFPKSNTRVNTHRDRNASEDMRSQKQPKRSNSRNIEDREEIERSSFIFADFDKLLTEIEQLKNENTILKFLNKELKENSERELSVKTNENNELKKMIKYLSENNKILNKVGYQDKVKALESENFELRELLLTFQEDENYNPKDRKLTSPIVEEIVEDLETTEKIKKKKHPIYKECSPNEADACAWVFSTPDKVEKYYYKFPDLGQHEVRAKVLYSSLCHTDTMTGRGKWGKWACCHYPLCAGHEVICEVIAVGAYVSRVKVGDHVGWGYLRDSCGKCELCMKGMNNYCQNMKAEEMVTFGLYFGGFSTHIQQPERMCIVIPKGVKIESAAPLLCAGITTFSPLYNFAKRGMKIAILGIGGLGHLAVQFAREMGLIVDAFNINPNMEKVFERLQIEKSINWKTDDMSLYENQYDLIINTIPVGIDSKEMEDFLRTLKPSGKFINLALADVSESVSFCQFSLVLKGLAIQGSFVGGLYHYEKMFEFVAKHKVECFCEFYEWDRFPEALDRMENGIPIFRCVINVHKESMKYGKKGNRLTKSISSKIRNESGKIIENKPKVTIMGGFLFYT